jgi:hypothetical protein
MRITVIIMLLLLPLLALADGIYRDKDGKYAGSWRGSDSHREYFGPDGSYQGAAERNGPGWTFRDKKGDYAGSSSGPSDRNPFSTDKEE